MPKVAFLIPASPNRGFFSQIAAFSLALSWLDWHRWEPSVHVCMGGEPDTEALRDWLPYLRDVATLLVPASVSEAIPWYYAQIDALYRWAPRDADVLVRMDADTLPVGDIEDLLDYVVERRCIAGVISHFPFPAWPGTTSREAWLRIARGLIETPLDFAHAYSLTGIEVPADDRTTPFYVNDGAVFFPRAGFERFSERYLALRSRLMERLPDPYYAGQVALALAAADIGARTCALPMRYNFPNDERATRRYPEELQQVKIIHYLRTEAFERHKIFLDADNYRAFLQASLAGVNLVFQDHVRRVIGEAYPFDGTPALPRRSSWSPSRNVGNPLSQDTYERMVAAHDRHTAMALEQVDTALGALEEYQALKAEALAAPESAMPAAVPPALDYAAQFEASGRAALEPLMRFKQALVESLGVERGFAIYRERLVLPDSGQIQLEPLASQRAFAAAHGEAFIETAAGGEPFTIEPPAVIGEGVRRPLQHVSRSLYVACLRDARVRGRSAVIEAGGVALLDYQGTERELFDCELDIDPAIFHATNDAAWVVTPDNEGGGIKIDEAFTLLGPHTGAFGDWMVEYLPRYIAADMSGALPPVPVLVDALLPKTIRETMELLFRTGVEVIEVPQHASVRVRRLWCGPSLRYAPGREKMDMRFKWDYLSPSPPHFLPIVREIAGRADKLVAGQPGPERVFLGRRAHGWRKLVNHTAIEAEAQARGFSVVFPQDLRFVEQIRLLRNARFVVAPEGSALFLAFFARPGTKICILNHPLIEGALSYAGFFDGMLITILTGPIVHSHPVFPHRADYEIDAMSFREFLDGWT
jgi:Glycosyltransferase 61